MTTRSIVRYKGDTYKVSVTGHDVASTGRLVPFAILSNAARTVVLRGDFAGQLEVIS